MDCVSWDLISLLVGTFVNNFLKRLFLNKKSAEDKISMQTTPNSQRVKIQLIVYDIIELKYKIKLLHKSWNL